MDTVVQQTSIWVSIATFLAPVLAAALTGGGIAAYFAYRGNKPEIDAKASQIVVASNISVADAWQNYAMQIEKRFNELEKKYDLVMSIKDREIANLNAEIVKLKTTLARYTSIRADTTSPSPSRMV